VQNQKKPCLNGFENVSLFRIFRLWRFRQRGRDSTVIKSDGWHWPAIVIEGEVVGG
jgi:hypothetical protein